MLNYGGTFNRGAELKHRKLAVSRRAKIRADFYPFLSEDVKLLCRGLKDLTDSSDDRTLKLAVKLITDALLSHHVGENDFSQ